MVSLGDGAVSIADYAWFPDPIVRGSRVLFRRRSECRVDRDGKLEREPVHAPSFFFFFFRGGGSSPRDVGEGVAAERASVERPAADFPKRRHDF